MNLFQRNLTDPRLLNSSLYQMVCLPVKLSAWGWMSGLQTRCLFNVWEFKVLKYSSKLEHWVHFFQMATFRVCHVTLCGSKSWIALVYHPLLLWDEAVRVYLNDRRGRSVLRKELFHAVKSSLSFLYTVVPPPFHSFLSSFVSGSAGACQAIVELKYWCRISKHGV